MHAAQVLRENFSKARQSVTLNDDETPGPQTTVVRRGCRASENEIERALIGCGRGQGFSGASLA